MKQSSEHEDFKSNSAENVPQEQIEIPLTEIVALMHELHDGFERVALAIERGAEPAWMQDVRIAQGRIETQRARLRPNHSP
jgi:hypothetical protein